MQMPTIEVSAQITWPEPDLDFNAYTIGEMPTPRAAAAPSDAKAIDWTALLAFVKAIMELFKK